MTLTYIIAHPVILRRKRRGIQPGKPIKLRTLLAANKDLAHKLAELERKAETHDAAIRSLVAAIRKLMAEPEPKEKRIGFVKESRPIYRTARKR